MQPRLFIIFAMIRDFQKIITLFFGAGVYLMTATDFVMQIMEEKNIKLLPSDFMCLFDVTGLIASEKITLETNEFAN